MAIIETAPVTNLQGGLIALAFAIAFLVLRAWLISPNRRFSRLVLLPPPVLPVRTSASDKRKKDLPPDGDEAFDETTAQAGARPRPPFADARSAYDGGQRGRWWP
jgi:hypothetical protein